MGVMTLVLKQWEDIYKPIESDDGSDLAFGSWEEAYDFVEKEILKDKEIGENGFNPYRYIWSRKDSEISESTILENGYRPVNAFSYIICMEPWGIEDSDYNSNIYIQVANYDDM